MVRKDPFFGMKATSSRRPHRRLANGGQNLVGMRRHFAEAGVAKLRVGSRVGGRL